jgi:tRNA pseudouridine38-40 synthase
LDAVAVSDIYVDMVLGVAMSVVRLIIEYDGTQYVGWQRQPNGVSVQQVVEEALAKVCGGSHVLFSSGRTDAGVHARGMVAHFVTDHLLPMRAYREGVNRLLPCDIVVRDAAVVPDDFHARYSATGKWYRYSIYSAAVRSPLASRYSWHVRSGLDLSSMRQAAALFVGQHDFSAFRATGCSARTTVRGIFSVDVIEAGALIHVDVRGSGFLRNMIRIMVGTLVEVGQGKRPPEEISDMLIDCRRAQAGVTAPPQGLCLMEVFYE